MKPYASSPPGRPSAASRRSSPSTGLRGRDPAEALVRRDPAASLGFDASRLDERQNPSGIVAHVLVKFLGRVAHGLKGEALEALTNRGMTQGFDKSTIEPVDCALR